MIPFHNNFTKCNTLSYQFLGTIFIIFIQYQLIFDQKIISISNLFLVSSIKFNQNRHWIVAWTRIRVKRGRSRVPPPSHRSVAKINPAASRRRTPPPSAYSPIAIPRRNDARRDARMRRRDPSEGCWSPGRGGRRGAASERTLRLVCVSARDHLAESFPERGKLDEKLPRAPFAACYPVPVVRQTTSSVWWAALSDVVEADAGRRFHLCSPDKASRG